LRLFSLIRSQGTGSNDEAEQSIKDGISQACHDAIRDFNASSKQILLHPQDAASKDAYQRALHAVFEEAVRLAMRLWLQRPAIQCLGFKSLAQEPFRVDSPLLQAHNVHRLDDEEDRRLDNRPVRMVLQPAVMRMGTHEGESYDQSDTWAKAVVFLDDGGRGGG